MSRVAPGFPDIAREHRTWFAITTILTVLALALWIFFSHFVEGVQIRHVQYVYGLFAAVGMLVVMGYGIRHKLPEVNAGHLRYWMQSHVYLSVVTFILFAIHTGFRAGGVLSFLLATCFYLTLVTGTLGWILFQTAPKMITSIEHYENLYADFPHINRRILEKGDAALEGSGSNELRNFYQRVIRPTLELRRPEFRHYLRVGTIDKAVEDMMFEHISRLLSEEDNARLNELRSLLDQKNEVLFQTASQRMLRGWLVFHVPVAVATIFLLGVHIIEMYYFYGAP